ncbi:non-specific lipid transfer protein GPI-anchored 30-like [Salvia divinorum]|uniref:Non-specific lipid transfer protein GPI-anchored 30-like n=1 Tax=Salvia divinorum TaxID=28513 RepID=A0ABD1H6V9_SALDI
MEHQIYVLKIAILFSLFISQNLAQVQQQQCMNELQPCLNYLNGNTRPSDSCCQNLDNVIKSMPECLCAMISVQGANLAEQYINVTEAQTLPGRCGQRINPLGKLRESKRSLNFCSLFLGRLSRQRALRVVIHDRETSSYRIIGMCSDMHW